MTRNECEAYVRAALAIHGYRFDPDVVAELVLQFERIERIAAPLLEIELPSELESAAVFRP